MTLTDLKSKNKAENTNKTYWNYAFVPIIGQISHDAKEQVI